MASAYDAEIDGLYYNLDFAAHTATVTYNSSYSGALAIPSEITYKGDTYTVTAIGNNAFDNCNGLTSVIIGIMPYAFFDCAGLRTIRIGKSVKRIGSMMVFANCGNIQDVFCHAVNCPNTSSDTFDGSSIGNAVLHVPAASLDQYKETAPWKYFMKIVPLSDEESSIREAEGPSNASSDYFTLDGRRTLIPHKGLNIVRSNNGQTRKVMVRANRQ